MKKAKVHRVYSGQPGKKERATWDKDYTARAMMNPLTKRIIKFRKSIRWQRFRIWFLNRHPLCMNPFNLDNHTVPATQVHHIRKLTMDRFLIDALRESNCAGLCNGCHGKINWKEKKGEDATKLFKKG